MLRRRLWQPRWALRLLLRVVTTLHHHRTSLTAAVVMMTTMNDAHVAEFRFLCVCTAAVNEQINQPNAFSSSCCSLLTSGFVLAETLRRCCTHLFPISITLSIVEAI